MNVALLIGGLIGMFFVLMGSPVLGLLVMLFVWAVGSVVAAFFKWLATPSREPAPDPRYDPDTYYIEEK